MKDALIFAAMMVTPVAALSQIPSPEAEVLKRQGFNSTEFATYDIFDISPHQRFYRIWENCVMPTAEIALRQDKTVAFVSNLVFSGCSDEESDMRASIARQVGVPKARRLAALARARKLLYFQQIYDRLHRQAEQTIARIDGWSIIRKAPATCVAQYQYSDLLMPSKTMLIVDNEVIILVLIIGNLQVDTCAVIDYGADKVWTLGANTHDGRPKVVGSFKFGVKRFNDGSLFAVKIDDATMEKIGSSDSLLLSKEGDSPDLTVRTYGISSAWKALKTCIETYASMPPPN